MKQTVKFRVFRVCVTLASIAVFVESLGAARRFG
jgi:hypothetical protein